MIKCMYICPVCGVNHLKDSTNSGDFYNTEWGIILQSFCPECGRMEPLVHGDRISKRQLKNFAIRIAMKFGLDFESCKKVAKNTDGVDYIKDFSKELNIPPEEISKTLNVP